MSILNLITNRKVMLLGAGLLVATLMITLVTIGSESARTVDDLALGGKVKRMSGDHLKLKDGRHVEFAGVRLPYDHEPYAETARRVLAGWLEDEGVRLQFDELSAHRKDRIYAYVYANDTFINERLVRDGLAFVKLRAGHRRHAETLLAAQTAAREEGKGLWAAFVPPSTGEYLADESAGLFHCPNCDDLRDRTDLVKITGAAAAFDRGLAPCSRCQSLAGMGP